MRTVRWGMIGCGDVTEVKSGPGFQKASHSSLVAVMRRRGELARDYAERHMVPRWYDDAASLINDAEVDAVYIATPPSSHKGYTLMCAHAGKPVYVEKPMALNFAECEEMIQVCARAGVRLFVAYYRRALARFLQLKDLVDSRTIGEIRSVNIIFHQPIAREDLDSQNLPWRVDRTIAGGGRFVDLASHMLDLLDYLFGPVIAVHGLASNQAGKYEVEDIVTSTFRFATGVQGTGTWCFTASENRDYTEIIGSEGLLAYSTFDAKPIALTTSDGVKEFSLAYPQHIEQPLIQTVVDEMNAVGKCPSSGESAARTSRVMDQMLAEQRN